MALLLAGFIAEDQSPMSPDLVVYRDLYIMCACREGKSPRRREVVTHVDEQDTNCTALHHATVVHDVHSTTRLEQT
jgi:hypothetical protein